MYTFRKILQHKRYYILCLMTTATRLVSTILPCFWYVRSMIDFLKEDHKQTTTPAHSSETSGSIRVLTM
jgi:hypothetical protein